MLVHWEGAMPACGDRVSLRAMAHSPQAPRNPGEFDTLSWLARKEVYTELKMDPGTPGSILSKGYRYHVMSQIEAIRNKVEYLIGLGISDDLIAMKLIKGITLGAKEEELTGFLDDFKLTGTMHLFAVSGLHVGMLAMIIWFALKMLRLPRWSAVMLTIPLLFLYVAMTGFRIGSLRAAMMTALFLTGFLLHRRPQVINSLAAAAFCLLLYQTNLLFSIGWQFSFCVVFAIVYLATPFQKILHHVYEFDPFIPKKLITPLQQWRKNLFDHVATLFAVSTAAWIGSLLPSIFYFHLISISSLGANVLAVPLAFSILALAACSVAMGSLFPWMAIVFNNSNWLCAKLLLLLIHGCTLLPLSSFSVGFSRIGYPRLTIFDFPSAPAAVLQTEGKTWLINTGKVRNRDQTLLPFFQEQGIRALDGLIVTDKKNAYSSGVGELLHHIISHAFFSPLMLHSGDHLSFSSTCFVEVLSPPGYSSHEALVLKIHLGQATLLFIPSSSPLLQASLLKLVSRDQIHATVLLLPSIEKWESQEQFEDLFLRAVAPSIVVVGSAPFAMHHHTSANFQNLVLRLKQRGITLLDQTQTGGLILEALPGRLGLHGFLNHQDDEIPYL